MINDLIDIQPNGTFYDRVVHLIEAEPRLYHQMVRANRLLLVAGHARDHNESLTLPIGTAALVAEMYGEAESRIKSLDGAHLDEKKALQAELEKLREHSKKLGYNLAHQN